jgi:ATP-dependent Lhr-like helicase
LIENYVDDSGNKNLIFHSLYGRRVNDALSRVFAYVLSRYVERSIPITVNDNGFILMVHAADKFLMPSPLELLSRINNKNFEELLILAIKQTELVKRKFRHVASRSFMILRNYMGHESNVGWQQISSERLFKVCESIENFPIIKETYREIIEDYMDVKTC